MALRLGRALLVSLSILSIASRARADDPPPSIYELELAIDLPLLGLAAAIGIGWGLGDELPPAYCAPLCDPDRVNVIDSAAAGLYSQTFGVIGDVGVGVALAGAFATVAAATELELDVLVEDAIVVAEAAALGSGIAALVNMTTRRPRPLLYSDEAPLEVRSSGRASFSFFSGHTASVFAATVAVFDMLQRRGFETASYVALAIGGLVSSTVAVTRVLAGHHFPLDVIVGAGVGIGIGAAVPAVHALPIQVSPQVGSDQVGVAATGTF